MKDGQWLALQLLLDSALPIGSFAHSYGLETLVQDGVLSDGAGLRRYVEGMLRHSWSTSDAMVIKAVYEGLSRGDEAYVYRIEKLAHLQRLAPESRDGIEKTGRRLLRLASELFPTLALGPLRAAVQDGRSFGSFPLVYASVCYELGFSLEQAAQGYLYACATTCVNAGLRLISMGQTEAQKLVVAMFPKIAEAWRSVQEMDPADVYGAMPLAELAMIRHETLYSRLFMS